MFTSWYLTNNVPGLKALFPITLICAVACVIFCLCFKNGRNKPALIRLAVALVAADLMTELVYYLGYMSYLPVQEPVTAARLFPSVLFPVLYFGCAGALMKVFNDMLHR